VKRDDLTGLGFGGNKIRQLEFYLGKAQQEGADTLLITGAVQSNFVRAAAAAAASLGMHSVLQLEDRVAGMGSSYHQSGNVLLNKMLGASLLSYPQGEDEVGADNALRAHAVQLRGQGRKPFVIPLGVNLLAGLRLAGCQATVFGSCVRRESHLQRTRLQTVAEHLAVLLHVESVVAADDIHTWDGALAPGYGQMNHASEVAIRTAARLEIPSTQQRALQPLKACCGRVS